MYQVNDAALLTRCYSQHGLRPCIDSHIVCCSDTVFDFDKLVTEFNVGLLLLVLKNGEIRVSRLGDRSK